MPPEGLSAAAGVLLLDLLEQVEPVVSQGTLADHFPDTGEELLERGLLVTYGSTDVVTAADDVPVTVIASPNSLGYFSSTDGWMSVSPDRLRCFRVDIPKAIAMIAGRLAWSDSMQPIVLFDDILWELGDARIAKRGPPASVWFARRLGEAPVAEGVATYAAKRPSRGPRILLTSTPSPDATSLIGARLLVVGVQDVLARGAGLAVDPGIVSARFTGSSGAPPNQLIYLSPDGRSLFIRREEVLTTTGEIQQRILARLVELHRLNQWCSAEKLLKEAKSESGSLPRAFGKKWPALRDHLENRNRLWRLIA